MRHFNLRAYQQRRTKAAVRLRRQMALVQDTWGLYTVVAVISDYLAALYSTPKTRAFEQAIKKQGRLPRK